MTDPAAKQHVQKRAYYFNDNNMLQLGERTLIMGILNTTPDSFSDGGQYVAVEAAVEQAKRLLDNGADIIDIGGESTRPGSQQVSVEEEIKRVIPIIEAIREQLPSAVLSIDTYKAVTAERALRAGVHIINDIWGLQYDDQMATVAATYNCPVIINHNRPTANYDALLPNIIADLKTSIALAEKAGIAAQNIWLDPGIGFAKNYKENLQVMQSLEQIVALEYPVLLGTSRKRFIQQTLGLSAQEVIQGTCATVVIGIMKGCQIVRVHDVAAVKQAALMTDAIVHV
ncbi:dihydropteroate synthase [Paenibacillus yanchengensis]|uniref:Dihydropteroate synthase n=1 Tax=Paenibacillus yanchengensis TaxID=2035833 RepID=A0ABW4YIM9_9BACL